MFRRHNIRSIDHRSLSSNSSLLLLWLLFVFVRSARAIMMIRTTIPQIILMKAELTEDHNK